MGGRVLLNGRCPKLTLHSASQELSVAATNMFKSLPTILGSMLYLSAASTRCILSADDDSPLYSQCGNPAVPSFVVNVFLIETWLMMYVFFPLLKEMKAKTWKDMMLLKMGKIEGLEVRASGARRGPKRRRAENTTPYARSYNT